MRVLDEQRYQAGWSDAHEGNVVSTDCLSDLVLAFDLIESLLYCNTECIEKDRCPKRQAARDFLDRLSLRHAAADIRPTSTEGHDA